MQRLVSPTLRFAALGVEDALEELHTSARGLSNEEAQARLAHYGPNAVTGTVVRWWHILGRQFNSPFTYLLIGAAVIALFLQEHFDAYLIAAFILIDVVLGFYQEYRSDQSLKLLRSYIVPHTAVLRDGTLSRIEVRALVPGDVVELKAGDIVPADGRLFECDGLRVNESILTGESVPTDKELAALAAVPRDAYGARNILFSGTTLTAGRTRMLVTATGGMTSVGFLSRLATETAKESDFAKGIGAFSAFILRLIVLTTVLVFLANVFLKGGERIGELLVFSIALAVSVIPEALPVVMVFSLSRGAVRLAREHVVVKRLSAIEDLGGIEVLCTDKTGTITENKLTVADEWRVKPDEPLLAYAMLGAAQAERGLAADPFDAAIAQALPRKEAALAKRMKWLVEEPFDPQRRMNSVLVAAGGAFRLIARGAPEDVVKRCRNGNLEHYRAWLDTQGTQGRRVLAVATRHFPKRPTGSLLPHEHALTLAGLLAFEDPIKPTTRAAVDKARALGVAVKIVTGDAPEVAAAVGQTVGLIDHPSHVILGADFLRLSPAEQQEAADTYAVFARVSPEEKQAIVTVLEEKYRVGFLGEGFNDAPALKAATVSLVVQGGSDIAREAADVILLQKSLAVVVDGIAQGREVFANTLKYIRGTLASNFGNFYAVAIGSLFIDFLPMLPVQILLLNLLSDLPMVAIATDTVAPEDIAAPQRYSVRDIVVIATLLGIVSTIFDFLFFAFFVRISPEVLQTNWFVGSVVTELVFLFSVRTRRFAVAAQRPSAPLVWLTGGAFAITLILPYTAIGQEAFRFTPPTPANLFVILSLTAFYFIATEVVKVLYYRMIRPASARRSS